LRSKGSFAAIGGNARNNLGDSDIGHFLSQTSAIWPPRRSVPSTVQPIATCVGRMGRLRALDALA
jgi:hypothetical protein